MIISHKHKFIFLKTSKTAGTSIEIALSKFCGDEDVITPIFSKDEAIRRSLGYRAPQNYLAPVADYRLVDILHFATQRKKKKRFFNHISAKMARSYLGDDVWNRYYKFCFERNPWDRVVSQYYWRSSLRSPSKPYPTISQFIQSPVPLLLRQKGFELYTISGEIAVDRVCLFENLAEEMEAVRRLVGIPERVTLPRAKSSFRQDKRHYREILSREDAERIARLFSQEISLFGYRF